nr:uncharacterized protein LOC109165175 [Ipomoea trifida]
MMNEQSKPGNPSAPVILPAKRRRGRPRKDGGVPKRGSSLTPATSAPEMVKKTQAVEANQMDGTVENMVGRMVSGVIDGCFDAGYFLTVRVGNSNTLLRGVIFQPGRFAPISASNDVAPQAKMYQRRDIPVPVPNLQGQNDGMIPQSDKLVKQPVQLGPQPAMDAQQVLPSKPTSSDTFVLNNQMNQPPSVMVPQPGPFSIQMNNMSRGGSGFPFGGKIMVHQNPDQRLQIQSQPGHRPQNLGMVEHDEVMQVFELSTQSEMPKVGSEGDKTDMLPSEGTSNNQLSQTHNQALGSMAQQCFMSYNLEQSNSRLPQNPAAATVSQTVDSESQDVESEMEKSQFDSGEVRHPNHQEQQHETPINSQPPPIQEKPSAMEPGPFVHSEAVELHQTPVVAELQFISQEPEAAESELKPSDPNNPNNELKSPVPIHHQDQTLEKLGTTQTPQPLEVEHASPNFECHHNPAVGNAQNVHQELMNDAMDFMMEKPASPKNNNATQHSPEGKPMSDPTENAMRGPQFSLESTGQILTLGIGGSDNPGRFDTPFYNPVSGTTDFGFVLGDFVPPTGNPNNMPETQHR